MTLPGLDADRQLALEISRHHRRPVRIDAFAHFHRGAAGREELVAELRLARGQRGLPVVAAVDDEHAHRHAEARERVADLRLHVDRPAHEAVVFERREALVGHEFDLRDQVLAGMRLEHAEVRRVAQLELPLRSGCLRADRGQQRPRPRNAT